MDAREPSELAIAYQARIVAHESPIDVPEADLARLSRYECRVLTKTAQKHGYSFHHLPAAGHNWLSRP